MESSQVKLDAIKLVGIKVRTANSKEQDWQNGKIFPCVREYYHQQIFDKIANRKKPGVTYCTYAEYESDYQGEYTYFIGEEVDTFDSVGSNLSTLVIPAQNYNKFTTGPGAMPKVLRDAWEKIWQMPDQTLGGKRNYQADFEIYDERAQDHNNLIFDIYIGIKP